MSQVLLSTLYDKLTAVQTAGTVYALVGGRIYQLDGPQEMELPALIFAIESNDVETYFGTSVKSKHTADVRFTIVFPANAAASVSTAMTVESALFALLNRASLTPSDASYTSVETYALSRGVPQADTGYIRIETTYRVIAAKDT